MRSSQNPGLHRSRVGTEFQDVPHIRSFLLEGHDEIQTGGILSYRTDDCDAAAEIKEVVGGVRRSTRNPDKIAILKNQDRSFTRNAGDLAVEKLICDQIPSHCQSAVLKLIQDFQQPVAYLQALRHTRATSYFQTRE